jgi:hypothetical protein
MTMLESKLAAHKIECDTLNGEIGSRTLTPSRRIEALDRWDKLQTECTELRSELGALRRSHVGAP